MASVFWITGNPNSGYQPKEQVTVKVVTDAAKKLMADKLHARKNAVSRSKPCGPWLSEFQMPVSQLSWTVWLEKRLQLSAINQVLLRQQWLKTNKRPWNIRHARDSLPKFEDETVALKLALTGAIKDQLLPMDEVTIFGLNYFKKHYSEKLAERFKQMKIEEEAPVIIMDMTCASVSEMITTAFTASSSRKSVMENSVTIP